MMQGEHCLPPWSIPPWFIPPCLIPPQLHDRNLDLIVVERRATTEVCFALTRRVVRVAAIGRKLRPPDRWSPHHAAPDTVLHARDHAECAAAVPDLDLVTAVDPARPGI